MNCRDLSRLLPLYLDDELDESRRKELRAHLGSCEICRARAMEEDPAMFFLSSSQKPVDSEGVERCLRDLGAMIRQERLRKRIRRPQRWWYAAAAAMLLVLSAGFFRARLESPSSLVAASEVQPTAGVASDQSQPPRMDLEMTHEGLRVYQFADTEDGNSAAYFIVDKDLEL